MEKYGEPEPVIRDQPKHASLPKSHRIPRHQASARPFHGVK